MFDFIAWPCFAQPASLHQPAPVSSSAPLPYVIKLGMLQFAVRSIVNQCTTAPAAYYYCRPAPVYRVTVVAAAASSQSAASFSSSRQTALYIRTYNLIANRQWCCASFDEKSNRKLCIHVVISGIYSNSLQRAFTLSSHKNHNTLKINEWPHVVVTASLSSLIHCCGNNFF